MTLLRSKLDKALLNLAGVGIAQNKILARLTNYATRKWKQTGGVIEMSNTDRQ